MMDNSSVFLPNELVDIFIRNRGLLFWDFLLQKKNINKKTIEIFELGYAPRRPIFDIWPVGLENIPRYARKIQDTVYESQYHLPGKMPNTGSGRVGQDIGSSIAIPIKNSNGDLIGFSARYIGLRKDEALEKRKYQRWGKGLPPYGAYQYAKQNKQNNEHIILVEGQSDLWKVWQSGFYNTLAVYGTSGLKGFLNPRQQYRTEGTLEFKKFITEKNIWLFMDGDLAGRSATVDQILLLKKAHNDNIINIKDVFVVPTPSQKDPGDLTEEEISDLLTTEPMSSREYIRWWMNTGIDTDDSSQLELLNRQLHKMLGQIT